MSAGTVSQEKEIARLLRAMDRSRRDTNRECYNADGTVKAAGKKIVWKESKTYKATKAKLADLYRRQAQTRRCLHGEVINQEEGDNHYDTISAFIKSMRGSDPDACLLYTSRCV